MELSLWPDDLKEEFLQRDKVTCEISQTCRTADVDFAKLNEKAQNAVRIVGEASYRSWDDQVHIAVFPPR